MAQANAANSNGKPARPRGGRYTAVPDEERCSRIAVRLTINEHIALRERARTAGLTMAEFLRRRCFDVPVVPPKATADARMLTELNRIGVNLNQLTKRVNAGDGRDLDGRLDAAAREVRAAVKAVADAYLGD
jgi:hypothetical protein